MKKNLLSLLLTMAMCISLVACGGEETLDEAENVFSETGDDVSFDTDKSMTFNKPGDGSWAVYWYLCGSDLESNGGFATIDLAEMMEVELPENVNVVIQTGGSSAWQNEYMDPDKLQRWLYNSEGLQLLEEQDTANMGDAQTLYEFLAYANENYPADKVAVTFWNHGGGSVNGAAFDELHNLDSIDLAEMYEAFDAVWPADTEHPALELVGFDTCLMATVDVAAVFQNFAKYLVGSEEVEPGNGWYYSGWLGELAEDPDMDGAGLGRAICDTYYEGCKAVGTQDQTTLSLTDLTKLTPLLEAYESFGQEAFVAATEDPRFFAELGRAAAQSENYGGNTREQGYTNMVDLGHLARQTAWMLPSAQSVCDALEECVLYKVNGMYRSESTGLSCYYSYNGDIDDFNGYIGVGAGMAFKHLFAYGLTGELAEGGEEYLYSVPILLNDEEYNLQVAYDYNTEEWSILGAAKGLDESGMAGKELRLLEEGDKITTIWKLASYSGDDDFEMYTVDDLTVTADTSFGEIDLYDGKYILMYEMWDAAGNYVYSDSADIDCLGGEMTTTI